MIIAPGRGAESERSSLNEVPDRVLGPPQNDPPIPVTECNERGTWCDACLREQPYGKLDTSLIINTEFGWFSDHETSVARSLSGRVDRLEQ